MTRLGRLWDAFIGVLALLVALAYLLTWLGVPDLRLPDSWVLALVFLTLGLHYLTNAVTGQKGGLG